MEDFDRVASTKEIPSLLKNIWVVEFFSDFDYFFRKNILAYASLKNALSKHILWRIY